MKPNKTYKLTAERLREVMSYDPETGEFTWLVTLSNRAVAGTVVRNPTSGYLSARIDSVRYLQHRLVWLYVHGRWPAEEIDHANGVKDDNRLCNLREATRSQNMMNKPRLKRARSKYRGVYFHAQSDSWMARVGKRYIGRHATEEGAHALYLAEMRKIAQKFPIPMHEIDEIRQGGASA